MIFTSISPNTERDDVILALRMLFIPGKWKYGNAVNELESRFKKRYETPSALAFQSGRNALYAMLSVLELEKNDEVLLQSYTCVAVAEPILWVGGKPVYIDIDQSLTMDPQDLEKKITPKSRVLIVQHTFGMPARMDILLSIAERHDLFVIEDCAHALGTTYDGKAVGTFGDAAFFSFGRDKAISSVFGGMLTVKNALLAEKIRALSETFSYTSRLAILQQLLHPFLMTVAKKMYGVFALGKFFIAAARVLRIIPKAVEKEELTGGRPSFFKERMPNAMAVLALNQFDKLEKYIIHRHHIAAIYKRELTNVSAQAETPHGAPCYLRYTIFIDKPLNVIHRARKQNIELGDWYTRAIAPIGTDYAAIGYDASSCPRAEQFSRQSINLPTHISITEADVQRIVHFLQNL